MSKRLKTVRAGTDVQAGQWQVRQQQSDAALDQIRQALVSDDGTPQEQAYLATWVDRVLPSPVGEVPECMQRELPTFSDAKLTEVCFTDTTGRRTLSIWRGLSGSSRLLTFTLKQCLIYWKM